MTQNLNLSLLGKYANTAGQIATSGISGGLPTANGGTGNDNLNVTAGGVLSGSSFNMQGQGGGGTSGQVLKYTGSQVLWTTGSSSGMTLVKSTFMTGMGQYITPAGMSLMAYKQIYLFFNNVTGGGMGTIALGSATLYPAQNGMNTSGLYGGFVIDMNSGVASGCIGRGMMGSDYTFAAVNSTNISSSPTGLYFAMPGLLTGGTVYCYGQT